MGRSAKFYKRPTRKERELRSTKGEKSESTLGLRQEEESPADVWDRLTAATDSQHTASTASVAGKHDMQQQQQQQQLKEKKSALHPASKRPATVSGRIDKRDSRSQTQLGSVAKQLKKAPAQKRKDYVDLLFGKTRR